MTFSPSGVNPALLIVAVAEHIPGRLVGLARGRPPGEAS